MKSFKILVAGGIAACCLIAYFFSITVQSQTPVDVLCAVTDDELAQWIDEELATGDDADFTCCGNCNGSSIVIGDCEYEANFDKSICVKALIHNGVNSAQCWAQLCGSLGNSSCAKLEMNDDPDAPESGFLLTNLTGEGQFSYPAKVTGYLYAKLTFNNMPTMTNSEPMVLEAQSTVGEWPPSNQVAYQLAQDVDFVTADGEHTATFKKGAVVRMRHVGDVLASR